MTPIAAMVKELLEKGVAAEAIVIAIEGAELAMCASVSTRHQVDDAAERRRAWDRDYRRRKRENPPESTRHPPDTENASISKERKKEDISEERGAAKRVHPTRGTRLPDDWAPSLPDTAIADEMLGGPERRRAELEKFRDHWKQQPGSKGVKLDWNAAWRNWIRRAAEYRGGSNGQRAHNANGRPAGGSFFDGLRSLAEDIAGDGATPRPAGEEIPRGRIEIEG